tara:strand:+ start:18885 stop:20027 length:1143 start_codon:yes stop_codon:yes gene_type:complete
MTVFGKTLINKITQSKGNNFGIENFDEYRFGSYSSRKVSKRIAKKLPAGFIPKVKTIIKTIVFSRSKTVKERAIDFISEYSEQYEKLWDALNNNNRELLVSLIAYRIMGFQKVKLARNDRNYWEALQTASTLSDESDSFDPKFLHFLLTKFDLKGIGYDVNLYFTALGVATDFIIEQYAYKENDDYIVAAEEGDVVFDLGACWGDTALYFADRVGEKGKVYSFEFIPGNIALFNKNIHLNPNIESRIHLIINPISNKSHELVYFKDNGPASKVSMKPFEKQTGKAHTISLDDFVEINNIEKVDFIKMDIEGAETAALEGALNTIRKFRPKLAIAIYHSSRDLVLIPNWIIDLKLDYEIFLGHYTIHSEETICFAKPRINK